MGVRASIYTRCTTHAGMKALIGTRCYPVELPQDVAMPAVTYHLISTPPNLYRDQDASPSDRWTYRVQIDCFAETPDGAAALGEQVVKAWMGYAYEPGGVGWANIANGPMEDRDTALNLDKNIVEIVIDHTL